MKRIKGALSALVTPYNHNGSLDLGATRGLVHYQLSQGLVGFLPAGSTGEGLLLSLDERRKLIETVVEASDGKAVVIAHVGAPATRDVLELARHAERVGVSAVAAIPPIYFKSSASNTISFYRSLAESVQIPVFAYHVPSATGVHLYRNIMEKLADLPNMVGMKYTDSSLDAMQEIACIGPGRYNLLYGCDEMLVAGLIMGAEGGIGSTYNIMPDVYAAIVLAAQRGEWEKARVWQMKVNKVISVLIRFGVIPSIKAILDHAGFNVGECRRPIEPLAGTWSELERALHEVGYSGLDNTSELLHVG